MAVIAAAAVASGCATVPTVGSPESVSAANGQGQQVVRLIPPVPQPGWSEQQIVQGFLAASASSAHKYAAARRFLSPLLRRTWHPGWAVTVLSGGSTPKLTNVGPHNLESTRVATVTLTGHQLATISDAGQYSRRPAPRHPSFTLGQFQDQWRITKLPGITAKLLDQADFEQAYEPRNLYFWSPSGAALIPEPAYAPQQTTYAGVAHRLVSALLKTPQAQVSWLGTAVTTSFPAGTTLLGKVTISGPTATVNLGGAAAHVGPARLSRMAAQLVTTLTSTSYSQEALSRSVRVEINGKVQRIGGRTVQTAQRYQWLVPDSQSESEPLYYSAANSKVSMVAPDGTKGHPIASPAGRGAYDFTTIAVSAGKQPELAGAVLGPSGCVIYSGPVTSSRSLGRTALPGSSGSPCRALSWDSQGDIWAVEGQSVWVLRPGSRQPVTVSLPVLPGSPAPLTFRVLSLKIAPDGVRAAMLIQAAGLGRQVILTTIEHEGSQLVFGGTEQIGTSLQDPAAISWYDADHLLVLDRSELYAVPANGGQATPVANVPPGTTSLTTTGAAQIAAGGRGLIVRTSGPGQSQQTVSLQGSTPAYPG